MVRPQSDNDTAGDGGGIVSEGGSLDIIDSTVSGNEAGGNIGGVYQEEGTANITNSTISGNRAAGSYGVVVAAVNTATNIRSSTIANNTSSAQGGGIFTTVFSDTFIANSIVSANTTTNCDTASGSDIISQGNNIERADSCGFTRSTDLPNLDPMLGSLSDNGGSTDTHALLIGSLAIDAGNSDESADQRGVTRPQDGDNNASTIADDIGAFEQKATTPNTAPVITADLPKKTTDKTPTLSASVIDGETELSSSQIQVFLDDVAVTSFSYNPDSGSLSFTSEKLKKGKHTLRIEATDGTLDSSESFSFKVKKKN